VVVVISGPEAGRVDLGTAEFLRSDRRLGFAAAVNMGIHHCADGCSRIALLNDDAIPSPGWLAPLAAAMDADDALAAVQGTVTDPRGAVVDGRGITLDEAALPVQVDRGRPASPEPASPRSVLAVSGTAALFRTRALRAAALRNGAIFDPDFGSYHEDLDLGLRLKRLGNTSAWVPGARVGHRGSTTGRGLGWHHPWWILQNRWRALAGNLEPDAFLHAFPTLLRGEARAIRTLARNNLRTLPTASAVLATLPWIVRNSLKRASPGPRLAELPETGR
jgi:GT2 family glycosyltransferase